MFLGLDEEKSLPWTVAALRRCGYKIDEPEDIVDVVASLEEDLPEIAVRVKKGFGNLDGLWEAKGEDSFEDDVQPEAEAEDDAPAEEEVAEEEVVEEEVAEEEAAGKLKVKVGTKVYPVKAEDAELLGEDTPEPEVEEDVVEDEPEEEPVEEAPKKKGKTVAKKPVAKKPVKKNIQRK